MSIKDILAFADKVTDAVKQFAPVASELGVPFAEKIAGLADTAVDILQDSVNKATEAKEVIDSKDQTRLDAKINELKTLADSIHQRVLNT